MKKNACNADRIFRFIVGLGLLSLLYILKGDARYIGLIGVVPIITGALGFCPAYAIFGINTCGKGKGSCCGGGSCKTEDKPTEDNTSEE